MPLDVAVEAEPIPEALQHAVHPRDPRDFVERVDDALETWERELEGRVVFRRIGSGDTPDLRIRMLARRAPTPRPDVVVLGATEALRGACRSRGWDPEADRLRVRFEVPELVLYLADEYGLLTPGQVERVALHEIGHALGMIGHSPMPSDLMYAAYRDRGRVAELSQMDVHSFVSLYRIPNGTHYGYVTPGAEAPRPPPVPPSGRAQLQAAPHVDVTRGFSLRLPAGWIVADVDRGLFAANGPVWEYDAALEVGVWPYATIEGFLARHARHLFADVWLRRRGPTTLAGREGLRLQVEDEAGESVYDVRLVPMDGDRLLLVVARCPVAAEEAWAAWFEASLATLQLAAGNLEGP
jgi:hypothetical protein